MEQLSRFDDAERLRRGSVIENFKRALPSVTMFTGDSVKLGPTYFGRILQRTEDYGPSDLQRARVTLGKCPSGKVRGRNRKLLTC